MSKPKAVKKPRKKKCKACKEWFQPVRPFQEVCKPVPCSLDLARMKREKKEENAHRERKRELKPISHWLNETQKVFNRWIVLRDREYPCISSNRWDVNAWHAGHYRTVGAASHLRFTPDNVHKQSDEQNIYQSGAITDYRINLINKIGLERVEALENDNSIKSWTYEELKEKRAHYSRLIKELSTP